MRRTHRALATGGAVEVCMDMTRKTSYVSSRGGPPRLTERKGMPAPRAAGRRYILDPMMAPFTHSYTSHYSTL